MKVCDHQCWARSFKNIYIIEACVAERRFIRSELCPYEHFPSGLATAAAHLC